MKHERNHSFTVVEAELLNSSHKLTGVQFAGALVLGFAFLTIPAIYVVAMVLAIVHREPFDVGGPIMSAVVLIGSFAVACAFGYFGWRLIRRAFQGN